jgi:uncharacterized protein
MSRTQSAEILRIHLSESDRYDGKPLYEAIVSRCREEHIAGATVLLGVEGYGAADEMHRAHLLHNDRPVVVVVVDTPANIAKLIPLVAEMMDTGVMAKSKVETIRVEKSAPGRT